MGSRQLLDLVDGKSRIPFPGQFVQNTESPSKTQPEIGHTHPSDPDKYDVTDQQMTRLAALKYQQALIRGSKKGTPQQTVRYGPGGETITDDILSNSSGETTATDSGRGYSEEDCHSQGRSSLPSETDDSGFPVVRFDCVRDPKKTWMNNSPSKNVLRKSIPLFRQCDGHSLQQLCDSDYGSRTTDAAVKLRHTGPRRKPYSVHFDKLLHDKDFQSRVPQHLDSLSNSCHTKSRLCDPNLTFHKEIAAGFSLDNLNDSVDDDNTTTTSGSYTIDHEELQEDGITFSQYGLKDVYV